MRRTTSLILFCFLILSLAIVNGAGSVIASKLQSGGVESKRAVTIKVKGGQSYRGTLTFINLDQVQINVSGNAQSYRLSDVLTISFDAQNSPAVSTLNGPGKLGLTSEDLATTKDVYKALHDLVSRFQDNDVVYVGIHQRVLYLNTEVRKILAGVRDNRSKEALLATLQSLVDADAAWTYVKQNLKAEPGSFLETSDDPVVKGAQKYKIPYIAAGSTRDASAVYRGIWAKASANLLWANMELE